MANNLTPYGQTLLLQNVEALQTVIDTMTAPALNKPTPLSVFSTRFSDLPTPSGIISIPVPTYPTSADDLSSGMVVTDINSTLYQLTVNRDAGKFFAFRPAEAQQYGAEFIVQSFIAPAIYAIDATLNSGSFALLNNFATSSVKCATANSFSASAAIAVNAEASSNGINGDRFLVLNSPYFWSGLVNDLSQRGNTVGAAAVTNGSPNNPFNTVTVEAQLLPTANNLIGFYGNASGIVLGTAIPDVKHANGEAMIYKSPWTNINYLVENYYDEYRRQHLIGASVIWNVASTNNTIRRLVSS
jgi:hypothetical protein